MTKFIKKRKFHNPLKGKIHLNYQGLKGEKNSQHGPIIARAGRLKLISIRTNIIFTIIKKTPFQSLTLFSFYLILIFCHKISFQSMETTHKMSIFTFFLQKSSFCKINKYILCYICNKQTNKLYSTMLVQFKFKNYKCFKEETVFNLVASNYFKELRDDNTIKTPFYSVVKSAAIFGANASGKTKLFQAFDFMQTVVLFSANNINNRIWQDQYSTFKFNTESEGDSSFFEVIFIVDNIQYRYGFELNNEEIISEWLFRKKTQEINVLYRDQFETKINKRYIKEKIMAMLQAAGMLRADTLYISLLSMFNDPTASLINNWFKQNIVLSTSLNKYMGQSLHGLETPSMKEKIIMMMQSADIGIEDLVPSEVSIDSIPDEIKKLLPKEALSGKLYNGVKTIHKKYDKNHLLVGRFELSMEADESFGTNKLFALSTPIIKTLEDGGVLWVDEIDSGIHYHLLYEIIQLFHSLQSNPKNGQIIINSQNIDLMDKDLFRRDQIYLTSKNRYGESSLKPITDFNIRNSQKISDLYRNGQLGAIPYLQDFSILFKINRKKHE